MAITKIQKEKIARMKKRGTTYAELQDYLSKSAPKKRPLIKTECFCNECKKYFRVVLRKSIYEIKCTKCGSYDTEPCDC